MGALKCVFATACDEEARVGDSNPPLPSRTEGFGGERETVGGEAAGEAVVVREAVVGALVDHQPPALRRAEPPPLEVVVVAAGRRAAGSVARRMPTIAAPWLKNMPGRSAISSIAASGMCPLVCAAERIAPRRPAAPMQLAAQLSTTRPARAGMPAPTRFYVPR